MSRHPHRRSIPASWILYSFAALLLFAGGVMFALATASHPTAPDLRPTTPVASAVTSSSPETAPPATEPSATPVATPSVAVGVADDAPRKADAFATDRAMAHIRELSVNIGRRVGGSDGEWKAIQYAKRQLESFGYTVTVMDVPLDNGKTSHDVIAQTKGASGPIVVLGGHIDTKGGPGADDNATGCGTVLELARDFANTRPKADLRFVLFGCEELIGDGDSNHHHYGSRKYEASLTGEERGRFAGMVSIDMIGYGEDFRVRTMGVGTKALANRLLAVADKTGAPLEYMRDTGSSGWSDHEPFERGGLPAAWLEWRDNGNAHSTADKYGTLDSAKVRVTGVLVHKWLSSLTDTELSTLIRSR